jgi:hypothetical protein
MPLYKVTKQDIEEWENNNINDLITDTNSLDNLEAQWNKWNQMTYKQRRVSDWEAQKIYNMSNKEYYESIKSKLLKNDETIVPIITESYILNNNDLVLNINNWKREKNHNILYVTGLSGSGKTTLAEEYERKYNAEMFEIDGIEYNYDSSKSKLLSLAKDKFPDYEKRLESKWKDSDKEIKVNDIKTVYKFIINTMHSKPDTLFIIEGVQLFELIDIDSLKNNPIIIKGTSVLKSIEQRFKRNNNSKINWIEELKNEFPQLVSWYLDSEKMLKKFKNNMKKSNNEATITINTSTPIKGLKILHNKDNIEQALKWQSDSLIYIITPQPTQLELNELWIKWNQMILKNRRVSDWKAIEIFGIDNKTHYEYLKSRFLENDNTDVDLDDSTEDNIIPDTSKDDESIKDYVNSINRECAKVNPNTLKIASMCMDLSKISYNTLSEKVLINRTIDNSIEALRDNFGMAYYNDTIGNNLPYFTPDELIDMGVYQNNTDNLYSTIPDNAVITDMTSTNKWFQEYQSFMMGYTTESYHNNIINWIYKLNELYLDFDNIKQSGDIDRINARKQSILELVWNPEIDFSNKTRAKVTKKMKSIIERKTTMNIIDISPLVDNNIPSTITEAVDESTNSLYPVFIVLVYTGSAFGKLIVKYTGATYSHSAIGFEPDLQRLYSYNLSKVYNSGLSFESLEQYKKDNDMAKLAVFAMFVTKKDLSKLKSRLDYFIANMEHTKYSVQNIFGILTNHPVNINLKMICSQFVDSMLKSIDINITGKDSALTVPNDFANVINPRVYKIFEGDAKAYDVNKVKRTLSSLQKNVRYIKESHINIINEDGYIESMCRSISDIDSLLSLNEKSDMLTGKAKYIYEEFIKPRLEIKPVRETKEFPIQFDDNGNLLIQKYKKLDFEAEYAQSHKLLVAYEKDKNLEGVKYELSKLWFMNNILQSKLYKSKDINKDTINKARAKILNDFNKYISFVNQNEENFNFISYYDETPFSDVKIKVNRSTLKYTGQFIKQILL